MLLFQKTCWYVAVSKNVTNNRKNVASLWCLLIITVLLIRYPRLANHVMFEFVTACPLNMAIIHSFLATFKVTFNFEETFYNPKNQDRGKKSFSVYARCACIRNMWLGERKLILCFASPGRVCSKAPGQGNLSNNFAGQCNLWP